MNIWKHQPKLCIKCHLTIECFKIAFKCDIPYSWCRNDSNEKDTTPAERVGGLEDEDVLQEECVQLSQLEKCRLGDSIFKRRFCEVEYLIQCFKKIQYITFVTMLQVVAMQYLPQDHKKIDSS